MSSKREEERNEKIIRGLLKLPPNRKCINCNSLGPQYVCTNFWTFVCITCSGIHREFTHRVKSVSMAKFTKQEVEALQQGGNQRARETYLRDWDMQGMRFPDSRLVSFVIRELKVGYQAENTENAVNPDKIRQFIKDVYVNKKYSGGKSSEKPPRDVESSKIPEDQRRASSYHSFSQSPPYDHQYEDRRYGKQPGMLSRRPGSDRGIYEGKTTSFMHSPGHLPAQIYEDRFANESSGSRMSDFSVSSAGDPYKCDIQSPSSQGTGYSSPSYQPRDIVFEDGRPQNASRLPEGNNRRDLDGIPRPKRTISSGSLGSSDENPISQRSLDPVGQMNVILEPSSTRKQAVSSVLPSSAQSVPSKHSMSQDLFSLPLAAPVNASSPSIDLFANFNEQPSSTNAFEQRPSASVLPVNQDLFSLPLAQPQNVASPSLNLFANFGNQPSSTAFMEQKPLAVPAQQNEGWATFDLPQNAGVAPAMNIGKSTVLRTANEAPGRSFDGLASLRSNMESIQVGNSLAPGKMLQTFSQLDTGLIEYKHSAEKISSELWNAFDDSTAKAPPASVMGPAENNKTQVPALYVDNSAYSIPVGAVLGSSFSPSFPPVAKGAIQVPKSINPFDLPYEDLETNKTSLNMSSLEATLPNLQMTNDYLAGLPQPWHPQNPAGMYIPSLPEGGGLQFMAKQPPNSQLPSLPPQGPVAPLGGNPFA